MSNVPTIDGLQFEQFVAEIDRLAAEKGLIAFGEQYYIRLSHGVRCGKMALRRKRHWTRSCVATDSPNENGSRKDQQAALHGVAERPPTPQGAQRHAEQHPEA
mgnify:CR=1 FL=1